MEQDTFTDKNGQGRVSKEQNHYYHCSPDCIRTQHLYFQSAMLQIESMMKESLVPDQSAYLKNVFQI